MSGPIDIVLCFHNAFRRDVREIDDAAFQAARNGTELSGLFDRLHMIGEILDYHAKGEEAAVFPAIDQVAPLVARAYFLDHRELDAMVAGLEEMRAAPDALVVARATAALSAHLRIHLNKEDAHLYPILRERIALEEQASIVGLLAKSVPPDKFPTNIRWLFPLLSLDDRVVVIKIWMSLMPPPVFAGLKALLHETVAADWTELTRRIPELA